ncbi:hypothetical protein [Fredinandcohnia sp. 179-A 10B2 NHS]|uniref:hypothetical protein n=1 Tax=Fredinandcohnia sp. 179-A 10B2 NHS TaxID=3235176 RepID=UPI0039A3DC53
MKKWILIGLAVVLLGTAGVIYYLLEIKEYDTADENVEEMVTSEYELILPSDETAIASEEESATAPETEGTEEAVPEDSSDDSSDTKSKEAVTQTSSTATKKSTQSQESKQNTNSSETVKEKTITSKSITDKYKPSFLALEDQANSKINSLVSYAAEEYTTKKKNGESISYLYFYAKYSRAGTALELKTDEAFTYLYKTLIDELVENGFEAKEAKPFKEAYESAKESRRNALLDKAKSYLN